MFNPKHFENSASGGFAPLEVVVEETVEGRLFVPLKRTDLSGEIVGPLASLKLTQVYGYTREQCDKVLEAVYRFPLPGDAAVTGVQVSFGDVEIPIIIREHSATDGRDADSLLTHSQFIYNFRYQSSGDTVPTSRTVSS